MSPATARGANDKLARRVPAARDNRWSLSSMVFLTFRGENPPPRETCGGVVAEMKKPDRQQRADPVRVEAPGIEPGSRGTSVPASTCVARRFSEYTSRLLRVHRAGFQRAGFRNDYRPGSFSRNGRRVGSGGCPRSSSSREPDLASKPQPLRRRVRNGSRVITPRG